MTIQSINPTTEEVIETFEAHTAAQIDEILTTVVAAQKRWRDRSFAERADVLPDVARSGLPVWSRSAPQRSDQG